MGDVIANLLVIFSEISLFRIRDDLHFENSRRTSPLLDPWPVNHWQWYYARANYARANYGIIEHIISGIDSSARTNNLHAILCMRPIRGAFTVSTEDHGASIRPLCMLATGARSSKDQGTDRWCSYGHIVFTTIGYIQQNGEDFRRFPYIQISPLIRLALIDCLKSGSLLESCYLETSAWSNAFQKF